MPIDYKIEDKVKLLFPLDQFNKEIDADEKYSAIEDLGFNILHIFTNHDTWNFEVECTKDQIPIVVMCLKGFI